jgi:molybdate transport system ATP-binding protein
MLAFAFEERVGDFLLAPELAVGAGVTALYGPSGAGKTLTLLALAGLRRPERGAIRLNGRTLFDAAARTWVAPHRRRVGLVFQEYALFPHLTVAGNLQYGLADLPPEEAARRVREMLGLLRLEAHAARYPADLSGGQRQRVALGRGLIVRPELLLLDEPFSALDQAERERIRGEVAALLAAFGGVTLLVTHSLEEAYVLASRVAVMDGGRILQVGPREEVMRRPRTRRVAEHVGAANIFEGRVVAAAGGGRRVVWGGHTLEVAAELPPPGTAVTLCIRPEDVRLVWPERAPGRPNLLHGSLLAEMDRGLDYVLTFRPDPGGGGLTILCSAHVHRLMKLRANASVDVTLPPDRLHLLAE